MKKDGEAMFTILKRLELNPTVTLMEIYAPRVAKKAQAGQFIILRVTDDGERIPLTIADYDREKGSVTIIFQIVGETTMKLNMLQEDMLTIQPSPCRISLLPSPAYR